MKVLIAIVMFLFGVFTGVLVILSFDEFSSPMQLEEEYSSPRVKTILHGFGVTLPLEVSNVNLYLKQEGMKKQIWVKFECSPEVRDGFIEKLTASHPGHFNLEIETPKMFDGTMVSWWTYSNTFRYYEFRDMGVAYDDIMRTMYLYAVSEGSAEAPEHHVSQPVD